MCTKMKKGQVLQNTPKPPSESTIEHANAPRSREARGQHSCIGAQKNVSPEVTRCSRVREMRRTKKAMGPDANMPVNFNITCSHSHTRTRTRAPTRTGMRARAHRDTQIHVPGHRHTVSSQGADTRCQVTCTCARLDDAFSRDLV
jgi:hypothetical protein